VVTGLMAEPVVDLLEAVDVDDHHRALAAVAGAEGDVLVELGAKAAPVHKPGERVVIGEIAQLRLGLLGPGQRLLNDLAVGRGEFLQDRTDRRVLLVQGMRALHHLKVVAAGCRRRLKRPDSARGLEFRRSALPNSWLAGSHK
jgi:hypothetical protein